MFTREECSMNFKGPPPHMQILKGVAIIELSFALQTGNNCVPTKCSYNLSNIMFNQTNSILSTVTNNFIHSNINTSSNVSSSTKPLPCSRHNSLAFKYLNNQFDLVVQIEVNHPHRNTFHDSRRTARRPTQPFSGYSQRLTVMIHSFRDYTHHTLITHD